MTWEQKLSLGIKNARIKGKTLKLVGWDKFILTIPIGTSYLETAKMWIKFKE